MAHMPAVLLDRALSFQRHGQYARAAAVLALAAARPCAHQLGSGSCGRCGDAQLAKAALMLVRVLRSRGTLVFREAVDDSSVAEIEADRPFVDRWLDRNAQSCVEACRWHLGIKREWSRDDSSNEFWRDAVDSQVSVFRARRLLTRGYPGMDRHAWMELLGILVDQHRMPGNRKSVAQYLRGAALLQSAADLEGVEGQEALHTDLLYRAVQDLAEAKQNCQMYFWRLQIADCEVLLRGATVSLLNRVVGSALPADVLSIVAEGLYGSVPPPPEPEHDIADG